MANRNLFATSRGGASPVRRGRLLEQRFHASADEQLQYVLQPMAAIKD
ncbi:hypothetical protein [Lysobacter antibioticus]|nr:hypothetical protein [Lysobacter antibioticus]